MIIRDCLFHPFLIDSGCLRKGIFLQLISHDGNTSTAEISPLPGHSLETLDGVTAQLNKRKQRILTTWWTSQNLHILQNWGLYPSVYFGLESALLDLLSPLKNPPACKKYGLLMGSPEEMLYRADEISAEGLTHVKIKVGHLSAEIAHELVEKLSPRFRLRLDFNRKWAIDDSIAFCNNYPDLFDYVEEPAINPQDLIRFPHPFALDETLRDVSFLSPILQSPYLKALIIKPTMLYPFTNFLSLGVEIVLSSSFEGSEGIRQLERLVQRLGLSDILHGLDTLRYFPQMAHVPDLSHCQ